LFVDGKLGRFGRGWNLHDVVVLLAKADTEESARTRAVIDQENSRHGYFVYARAPDVTKQRS
jgi:hypothetical protein